MNESGAEVTCDRLPAVIGDPDQLAELLQNLIGNAIKFQSNGTPRIHIGAERRDGEWIVSVRDNGIGIDPQFRERIFVIFQRLHGREEYPGTGIGLAICKKIVTRHGGRIWADSEPGKGATFSFTVPAAVKGGIRCMNAVTEPRPIEILLVEDNPGDVRLTREVLKDGKFRNNMSVASDGQAAMDYLHRNGKYADAVRPDVILLDLNLPIKDGRAVLAEIKQSPELMSIPIVILTTSAAEADILKTYNLHANCYIVKPVDLAQFVNVIRYIQDFWLTIVKLPGR